MNFSSTILKPIKTARQQVRKKLFKGIFRPFEIRGMTGLIRSGIINWRLGKFFLI